MLLFLLRGEFMRQFVFTKEHVKAIYDAVEFGVTRLLDSGLLKREDLPSYLTHVYSGVFYALLSICKNDYEVLKWNIEIFDILKGELL